MRLHDGNMGPIKFGPNGAESLAIRKGSARS